MTLIKTSLLNSIAVVIKILTLLGINKILAIYVGPSGYAAIGQFQNAVQMLTTFASGAINTGVTKYTAEYYDDDAKQRLVWRTAGFITLVGALVTAVLISTFNEYLAAWFLKDASYGGVFIWFAVTLVPFVFNTLLLAILNGKKEISRYVMANIAGSVFALIIVSIMVIKLGLYGALVALAVYQSISFLVTLYLCYGTPWFKIRYLFGGIDKQTASNFGKYIAMALTSAVCVPVSHMLIRNYLGETIGWDAAGYWEAMWRLSSAYLMFVTTTLSVYYLPRLSELQEPGAIKQEIIQGYKIILPVGALCGLIIYLLRDFIIQLLFSAEFAPMKELFAWQMVGDVLRIACFILGYVAIAKAMTMFFIVKELLLSLVFVILCYLIVNENYLKGVVIAYVLTYILNIVTLYFFVMKKVCGAEDV